MCGPIRLMDAVRRGWQDAGLPPANLRYETFGSSGWFEPEEFVARVPQRQVETTVRTDETLLEALTRAGVDLMYDCRKGECGLCLLDVVLRGGHARPPRRLPQQRPSRPAAGRWRPACPGSRPRRATRTPTVSLSLP